MVTKKRAN